MFGTIPELILKPALAGFFVGDVMSKEAVPQRKVAIGPFGNAVGYFFIVITARAFPDLFPDQVVAVAMAGAMFTFVFQYWIPNK